MLPVRLFCDSVPHLLPAPVRKRIIDAVAPVTSAANGFAVTYHVNLSRHYCCYLIAAIDIKRLCTPVSRSTERGDYKSCVQISMFDYEAGFEGAAFAVVLIEISRTSRQALTVPVRRSRSVSNASPGFWPR